MLLLSTFFIMIIICVCDVTFSTHPSHDSNRTWAFGYPSLVEYASFKPSFMDTCYWRGDYGKLFTLELYYNEACFVSPQPNQYGAIMCSKSNGTVNSSFAFVPLHKSINVSILCGGINIFMVNYHVQNCSSSISHNIVVHADRHDYGAKGMFGCSHNGDLFSSSGTKIQSNSTKCLAHATWEGQEDVQCWSAPVVQLMPANITAPENETVNISCHETSLSYPPVHFMEVVVDGEVHMVLSNSNGSLTLKRSWNGKTATCRATSNYTLKTNQPATSKPVNITVYYDPYSNERPTACTLYLSGPSSPCKVKFFSNPPITTYNFTKNGLPVTTDKHDLVQHGGNGLQVFIFSKSQVSNSDAGLYTLSVESGLNPGNFHKRLVLNFTVVVKQAPPTTQQTTQPTTNIALIAGASAAGVVLVILATVLVVVSNWRKYNMREGNPGQNSAPSPVSYYNTRGNETTQGSGEEAYCCSDNQAAQNPQAGREVHENVHHYEAIRSNNRDDNRPTINQQVPSPSYESAHQYERPIRANEQDDSRPAISQQVPSLSYESAHQYERPIRANEQDDNRPAISQQASSPSYESAHQYERPIRANEQDDNRSAINQQAPSPSHESVHQYERPIRANEQDVADGAYIDFNI